MNVLAINASAVGDRGNTAILLDSFLAGLRDCGAQAETVYTREMTVGPCTAELHCWRKTPGRCIHRDDMDALLPKVAAADVLVLAAPIYCDALPGPLKTVMDRLLPLVEPFYVVADDHCCHPPRGGRTAAPRLVLVSSCGLWELDNFDPALAHLRAFCRNARFEFAGALLRPHGPVLGAVTRAGPDAADVLEAAREAGRQLARTGTMQPETLAIVSRPLMTRGEYIDSSNCVFQRALDRLKGKA